MKIRALLSRAGSITREMAWFTPERGRIYSVVALITMAACMIGRFWQHGAYDPLGIPFGQDFVPFWAAGHLVRDGLAAGPYIPAMLNAAEKTVYPPGVFGPFLYPPPFLIFCLFFSGLPFFWALAAYTCVGGAAYATAMYRATGSCWIVFAALAIPAMLINLTIGQDGMLMAAALGGGLTLMDRRPRTAGLILGLMVVKPHLALAVSVALMLSRRWTVLGFAILSSIGLIVLSFAFFGWNCWHAFLLGTKYARYVLEQGATSPANKFQSVFAVARLLGCSVNLAYGLQMACAAGAFGLLVAAEFRGVSDGVERSLIVLVSLLVTPYLMPYDLILVAFPLGWLLTKWTRTGFPRYGKLVLILGYLTTVLPLVEAAPPDLFVFGLLCLLIYVGWSAFSHLAAAA